MEDRVEIDPYILGLWCADAYWWSSSVGLSNVEPSLITRFGHYLIHLLDRDRLRLRVYRVGDDPIPPDVLSLTERVSIVRPYKMGRNAYHVYVNSRPLLRAFIHARQHVSELPNVHVGAYFAGRFDGDGSWGTTPRITYSTVDDARGDQELLDGIGITHTSVLYYATANEYALYIHKQEWWGFHKALEPYSWKLGIRSLGSRL